MSIKTKILLSFIILIIVPTALLITYMNQKSYEMYCDHILELEDYALDKLSLELTYLFEINTNAVNNITTDTTLYTELQNLLSGKELSKGNAFYLISKEEIVATSDIQIQFPKDFTLEDIIQNAESGTKMTIKDGTSILLSTIVPKTPFTLVSLVSTSSFKDSHLEIGRNSSLIAIIVSCLSCIIALLITNSIARRIQILRMAMSAAGNGDFEIYVKKNGRDEISQLETGFNEMILHIKKQMNKEIYFEQEYKNSDSESIQIADDKA